MTRIAYVSNDDGLAALFQAARLAPNRLTEDEARTLVRTAESPVVLVLDGRRQQRLVHWAQGFLGGKSTVAVLLLVKALDYTSVPDAMQAGVRDCLPEPLAAAGLDRAVRRLVDLVEAEGRQATGQVVAFVGAKGGVGTTTLAANTATSVARLGGVATLLVDLHLTGGDVALFMGTQTRVSVLDVIENLHQLDRVSLPGLDRKSVV